MRHVLPVSLATLLFFILTLSALSLYQQIQVYSYQKRASELMKKNQQLAIEQSVFKNKISTFQEVYGASSSPREKTDRIEEIIKKYDKKTNGDLSVFYKNLTNNETYILNGEKKYYMASLYKVIVTLYILEREKNGELALSQKVGSPSATLETALNRIITESNNEYAQAIAAKYGWEEIESYIEKRFAINFSFKGDLSSDVMTIGALFQIISEAIKLSDTESKYLLGLLNHQTRLNKLPKYLPKHIYSHNKTGEFEQYSHDAGLFYTPKANYILIFMSKSKTPEATNEQMAKMSKEIYDVLNQ